MSELGLFDGSELGPPGGAHGRVVVRVPGGLEQSGRGVEGLTEGGEEGRPPGLGPRGRPRGWSVRDDERIDFLEWMSNQFSKTDTGQGRGGGGGTREGS